jgi:hypothetical protein
MVLCSLQTKVPKRISGPGRGRGGPRTKIGPLPISIRYQPGDTRRYPNISLPVGDVDKQVVKVARAARWATLHYAGLRGEGSSPVPLSSESMQKCLHGEIEVDTAGVTGYASVEAAEQAKQRHIGTACLQVPQGDIERRQREHGRSTAAAVVQGPPDVMPDGLSVMRFAALDQFGNLPSERIGNRAAIAADSVSIANTFGPVGSADTASYQFEGGDFAVRAVREANGERDPIEPGVD